MSLETCKIPEANEMSDETKELEKKISGNLNEADKNITGEILEGYCMDPNLSDEANFQKAFDEKTSSLLNQHTTLESEKLSMLLNSELHAGGKSPTPQEMIKKYYEMITVIGTDVAEANKNKSDILAQQNTNNEKNNSQKQNDFITELKSALNRESERKKTERKNNKEKIAQNNNAVEAEKATAELVLAGFPDSCEKQTA